MRVLHFTHCFFPIYGGTSTRLYSLLSKHSNNHYLYVPYPPNYKVPVKDDITYDNIKIRRYRIDNIRKFFIKLPYIGNLSNFIFNRIIIKFLNLEILSSRLVKLITDSDIQISHGHNPLVYGLTALKFAKKNRIPLIYEFHLFGSDTPIQKNKNILKKIGYSIEKQLIKRIEKKIIKKSSIIIVQTRGIKRRIIRYYNIKPKKVIIIPMGVDENLFNPERWDIKAKQLRTNNNWQDKIVVMYNGYFQVYNGLKLLLDSIIELPFEIKKKIKVLILGRGPLEDYVKKMAANYNTLIEYIGLVDFNEMPLFYSASDILVNPRISFFKVMDNVPTKMLEGMAMKKIILASDINSITEIIRHGKNGFIFQNNNRKDLVKKIVYIIENFNSMSEVKNNARNDVIKEYCWSSMREKLNSIYQYVKKP